MPLPLIIGAAAFAALGTAAKKAFDGYESHSQADAIVENAKRRYQEGKATFDQEDRKTQESLSELGSLELEVGRSFDEFSTIANNLLLQLNEGRQDKLNVNLPTHKLTQIEAYKFTALGVLGSIAGAGAAGVAAGFAVYGGVMTFAAASTGTAIASLSGVAATNATLAAIGGGALSAGGLGMAGGMAILGAAVAAPVLAVAAWAYASHGEDALKNAYAASIEANKATDKLKKATHSLRETREYTEKVQVALHDIFVVFQDYLGKLREIDRFISSAKNVSQDEEAINRLLQSITDDTMRYINNGYMLAAILTDIIVTPLFKLKQENGEFVMDENGVPVMEKDNDESLILNTEAIDAVIAKGKEEGGAILPA